MKLFCVVWLWIFLSGFGIAITREINTRGYSGKHVIITCSHKMALKNLKYFCRDPCTYKTSVLVSSDQSLNVRYRLDDLGNGTFTVKITDLQESDSGIYWCGVKRSIRDTYDKVTLTVSEDPNESITTSTQPYKETQTSLDLHTTTPVAHSGSPSTTASLTSRDSSPDVLKLSNSVKVSAYASQYAFGGLVIAAILFLVGLVTVHQSRKRVKTSESCATATPANRNNTSKVEENSTEMKSTDETEVKKSQSDSVYQNLNLSTVQSNEVYQSLIAESINKVQSTSL